VAEADAGLSVAALKCLGIAFDIAGQIDLTEDRVDDIIQLAVTQVSLGQRQFARKTLSAAISTLSVRPIDDTIAESLQDLARAEAWVLDPADAIRAGSEQSSAFGKASMKVGVVQGMLSRREGKVLLEPRDPLRPSFF
jgi:hypothetical protein